MYCNTTKVQLYIRHSANVTIEGVVWIGCGGYNLFLDEPTALLMIEYSSVNIQKNFFNYLKGPALRFKDSGFLISHCKVMNSYYRDHGAAIILSIPSHHKKQSVLVSSAIIKMLRV